MSKEELDGLFRNKLQEHEMEPSPGAWERLESSLPEKGERRIFYWWHAAAAILLLAVAGWIFWPSSAPDQARIAGQMPTDNSPAATEAETMTQPESPETVPGNADQLAQAPTGDREEQNIAAAPHGQEPVKSNPSETNEGGQNTGQPVLPLTDTKEQLAVSEPSETPLSPEELEKAEAMAVLSTDDTKDLESAKSSGTGRNTTLTISIEEFDEALLPDQPDSTGDGEKSSKGLKKLWAAVKNAPSSLESGLGELREAKNDLLSLDKETEKP